MPESKLFLSSISRRDLARRRSGRGWGRAQLLAMLLLALVVAVGVGAYLAGRGSL
ncbi:MAG TPA: hypothetical protein VGL51_15280 [Solirubrobacteraceae bacterium]|jgi:MFS-type transporter involved in bile tolerance (Atg22 family)